jgi:CubicO group peptidase (beta-lactamase class C family)
VLTKLERVSNEAVVDGTWFWIDPKNKVVFVGMVQNQSGGETKIRSNTRQH